MTRPPGAHLGWPGPELGDCLEHDLGRCTDDCTAGWSWATGFGPDGMHGDRRMKIMDTVSEGMVRDASVAFGGDWSVRLHPAPDGPGSYMPGDPDLHWRCILEEIDPLEGYGRGSQFSSYGRTPIGALRRTRRLMGPR